MADYDWAGAEPGGAISVNYSRIFSDDTSVNTKPVYVVVEGQRIYDTDPASLVKNLKYNILGLGEKGKRIAEKFRKVEAPPSRDADSFLTGRTASRVEPKENNFRRQESLRAPSISNRNIRGQRIKAAQEKFGRGTAESAKALGRGTTKAFSVLGKGFEAAGNSAGRGIRYATQRRKIPNNSSSKPPNNITKNKKPVLFSSMFGKKTPNTKTPRPGSVANATAKAAAANAKPANAAATNAKPANAPVAPANAKPANAAPANAKPANAKPVNAAPPPAPAPTNAKPAA